MPRPLPEESRQSQSFFRSQFFAGFVAAGVSCLALQPIDVLRTRMQAGQYQGRSSVHAMKTLFSKEGVRGLWRGIGPSLAGVAPTRAVHFQVYGWAKALEVCPSPALTHLCSAGFAGCVAATVSNPIWVVKTRMQVQPLDVSSSAVRPYRSSLDCLLRVFREEGVSRGLMRGVTASSGDILKALQGGGDDPKKVPRSKQPKPTRRQPTAARGGLLAAASGGSKKKLTMAVVPGAEQA